LRGAALRECEGTSRKSGRQKKLPQLGILHPRTIAHGERDSGPL
jgi:hypothetical protein